MVVMEPVTRRVLLDARFPQPRTVDRIEAREIVIQPGFAAGLHVHNGPVVGCVLDGSVYYQIEGEPETVLRRGDVFYEPENARIARFDATDEGVTFVGYFPVGPGEEPAIEFPES